MMLWYSSPTCTAVGIRTVCIQVSTLHLKASKNRVKKSISLIAKFVVANFFTNVVYPLEYCYSYQADDYFRVVKIY